MRGPMEAPDRFEMIGLGRAQGVGIARPGGRGSSGGASQIRRLGGAVSSPHGAHPCLASTWHLRFAPLRSTLVDHRKLNVGRPDTPQAGVIWPSVAVPGRP